MATQPPRNPCEKRSLRPDSASITECRDGLASPAASKQPSVKLSGWKQQFPKSEFPESEFSKFRDETVLVAAVASREESARDRPPPRMCSSCRLPEGGAAHFRPHSFAPRRTRALGHCRRRCVHCWGGKNVNQQCQGPFRDYTALLAEFPDLVTALVIPMRSLPAAAGCPTQPHTRPLASSVVVALFGSVFMRFRAERDIHGPAMYSYKPAALFSSL